ncbi:MAG: type I DNA topoisomerase [Alphaproteobacteria bacterium]|nr:MAG: type I DNA topoisomerase [Alphaproteobacteria bacterium]
MDVVVVESPTKAKTINKYLGRGTKVLASFGHVRDLPAKDGSVDPEHDFKMTWRIDPKAQKHVRAIAEETKKADRLILATDPDREGEAISWHVLEILKKRGALKGKDVQRVVFHEITPRAIREAMANPRGIDEQLVNAYLARRALDYLVGFTLSPVLWRKLPGARSAGRVQSVALRLICEREIEIEQFRPRDYWTVEAVLAPAGSEESFRARLVAVDGRKLEKFALEDEAAAKALLARLKEADLHVRSVDRRPVRRMPPPPFTTSTLQQEAARKLGFGAKETMRIAQSLYEGKTVAGETIGLITYMRTDSVAMAAEAIAAIRSHLAERWGREYVPEHPHRFRARAKNAQEAHEAIRPTNPALTPEAVRPFLDPREAALYELIWKRAIASQTAAAELEQTKVTITSRDGSLELTASGQVLRFAGFLRIYEEGRDENGEEEGGEDGRLPSLAPEMPLALVDAHADRHTTKPPPRYTEASLVKKLEELGIGRPSTYATILSVLQERNYVRLERRRFVPEDKGRLVTAFLESFFDRYVEYDFTAELEEALDAISRGEKDWRQVLADFWRDFSRRTDEVMKIRTAEILERLNDYLAPMLFPPREDGGDPRACPECGTGRLSLKVGRFGAFIGCSHYPECRYTRRFADGNGAPAADQESESGERLLGTDPETGREIWLKTGRFGPYVERAGEDGNKPARVSLPKGIDPADVDLALACRLLALPREIGRHPETGEPVIAGIGRYGPYVAHQGVYANLADVEEVFTIGMNRALQLIAEKTARRSGRGGVIRVLGEHPESGEPVELRSGRYGPYVKQGRINASLPKDMDPETIGLDEALALLEAKRRQATGSGRRTGSRRGQ